MAEIWTHPRFYACSRYLQVWKDRIKKTTKKRWRHFFPHYKSTGVFCCHGNQFWSNLPQNLMQPFPHPSDATHKFLSRSANWLQRYSREIWFQITTICTNIYSSDQMRLQVKFGFKFQPYVQPFILWPIAAPREIWLQNTTICTNVYSSDQ